MQIVMFDRQSIFIHGMKISLQQRIPGVSIQGASQADELWQKLESYPEALVMLDGDQDGEFCYWLLQKTVVQFPEVKVLITAMGMMFLPGDWRTTPEKDIKDLKSLSARQREILTMLAAGESNKEIGRALNISTGTVKAHLESLYRRLEVKNRTQAAMMLNISS
ncbi:DNA-binding response regulator [Escherichia coli]|nr:DNA-binding response regulator [Escherichia coli]EGD9218246.1 DNA-binding response regulator [Escherichia coli]EKD5759323.1 response regulator transcription factor [Escherichia coli]